MGQVRVSSRDRAAIIQAQHHKQTPDKDKRAHSVQVIDNNVGVLMTIDQNASIDALTAQGLKIEGRIGNHIYGTAPINNISSIAGSKGVKAFSLSRTARAFNDKARAISRVDEVQAGTDLLKAYNGEGITVALYDTGLDPNHIAFKDSDGKTRVSYLRCYDSEGNYEEYTSETIDRFTTDDSDATHGTHVLGTIAGSCRVTDDGNDYHGIAPNADIAIACGSFEDLAILKGVQELSEYSKATGRRMCINMSLGDYDGPHDGTDTNTAILDEISKDTPIIVSAGNAGTDALSIVHTFTQSEPEVKTLFGRGSDVPYYIGTADDCLSCGYIDIWSEDDTPVKVYLDFISSTNYKKPIYSIEVGEQETYYGNGKVWYYYLYDEPNTDATFDKYFTNSFIGGYTEINPANNRYHCSLSALLNPADGKKVYAALRVEGTEGKKVYIIADDYGTKLTDGNFAGYTAGNGEFSIQKYACGTNIISVGSYTSRSDNPDDIGKMSYFSSYGVLHDGRVKPDVVAPGSTIYSAYSTQQTSGQPSEYTTVGGTEYGWGRMIGTSMSAPHVTGIVALMLQANPNLTTNEIQTILKETATPIDDARGGAGKVNAFEAVKKAENYSAVSTIKADAHNIAIEANGNNSLEIFAPSESMVTVSVHSLSGATLKQARVSGNYILNLDNFTPGIYVINVKGDKSSAHKKIAIK